MRRFDARWMLPVLVLALAAMSGCAANPPATPAVDQAAIGAKIDSLNTVYIGAVGSRDTTALVNLYTDDAHMMPANMARADGHDAIHKSWAGVLAMPGLDLKFTSNTKVVSEAGDMAVDLGTYTFAANGPKGKPMTDNGKYVTVWKKVNGEWKILVDTFNSDMPAPGM